MLIERLKALLGSSAPELQQTEVNAQLACAALLLEVSRSDGSHSIEEKDAIWQLLQKKFDLSPRELQLLFEEALSASNDAPDLYSFTSTVKKNLNQAQKVTLIRGLWQVAYADGRLEPTEEAVIRKVSDLLYISHQDYISAKLDAAK
jgi:uncharacterized tellurite resistance protein B-like protein